MCHAVLGSTGLPRPNFGLGRSAYLQREARQAETIRDLREQLGRTQGARQRESLLWEVQLAHVQLQSSPDRMHSAPPADTAKLSGTPPIRSSSAAVGALAADGGRLPMARLDTPEQGKSATLSALSSSSASAALDAHSSERGNEGTKKVVKKVRPSSQVSALRFPPLSELPRGVCA